MDTPLEATARKALMAFAEGEAATYLHAYKLVTAQLEKHQSTDLLVNVVNTVLQRMVTDKSTAVVAGRKLIAETKHPSSHQFVLAAVAEVMLNERKAGEVVTHLPSRDETLARWA